MRHRKSSLVLLATTLAIAFAGVADAKLSANKLAANKIILNRISLNRISLNHLEANEVAEVSSGAVNDVLAIQLPGGELITR